MILSYLFPATMNPLLPFLLIVPPLLMSCSGASQPAEPAPAILAQWSGAQGGAVQAETRVVRAAEEWRALWQQVGRDVPRALNPGRELGLAVFLGERRTGGYAVDVAALRIQAGRLVVEYRETAPAPDALTTQVLTYPWAFALMPNSDLPIEWRKVTAASGDSTSGSTLAPSPPQTGTRQER